MGVRGILGKINGQDKSKEKLKLLMNNRMIIAQPLT